MYCTVVQCIAVCRDMWRHLKLQASALTLISGALTADRWSRQLELYQQTADSFRKYFTQIFYAKLIFVQKIFFCAKVHKFGESKLIWVKKVNFEANIVFNVQCKTVELGQSKTIHYTMELSCTVYYSLHHTVYFYIRRGPPLWVSARPWWNPSWPYRTWRWGPDCYQTLSIHR